MLSQKNIDGYYIHLVWCHPFIRANDYDSKESDELLKGDNGA